MAVTMKDIAQKAGCSIATVSKVVNRRDEHISEPTRQRILALVKKCGYKPNSLAKGLKLRHTNTIGFVLPDITNPYFATIARGIESAAKQRGFAVIVYNTDNDAETERGSIAFMDSKMVDGLIMVGFLLHRIPAEDRELSLPTVLLGMDAPDLGTEVGYVRANTEASMADITNLLLDQGCRRVGLLCARADYHMSRPQGYQTALTQRGLEVDPELIVGAGYDIDRSAQGASVLIDRGVDGIVCGNDLSAVGALQAARERGVSVPDQLKLASIDDILLARFLTPPLTTVSQPGADIGAAAANMLIDRIVDGAPFSTQELPYHLVRRETA